MRVSNVVATRRQEEHLLPFQTLSVNLCTRSSFKRTDRVVNINLYYTRLMSPKRHVEVSDGIATRHQEEHLETTKIKFEMEQTKVDIFLWE